MTFGQLLSILRARWRAASLTFLIIVGIAAALTILLPRQYTALGSVVVDARPDPVSAFQLGSITALMATQVDIITSERVARRAVRTLRLTENEQVRQQWTDETGGKGDIEAWLAALLLKNLDVKPARESNVINLAYKAPDPGFAAGIVNAFAQAYIATTLELRVNPARQFSTFFDDRAKEARERLETAQARLSDFQRTNGIIATDERLDVENARLNELSSQVVMLEALAAESSSRQVQAQGASADRIQEVLTNPLISGLKADLSRAEARLRELSSRYGDNHPSVIEAQASIDETRRKIEVESRRVSSGVSVSNNINRQRLGQVRAELESQRSKVLKLKAVRDEGAVIVRDVENAQRTYDAILNRSNQSTLESQTPQSNVNVLTVATPPTDPSSPKILINAIVAIALGILLAVAVAVMRELRDRRARTLDDLKTLVGLPIVGVLPSNKKLRTEKRQQLMFQDRVLGYAGTKRENA